MELVINFSVTLGLYSSTVFNEITDIVPVIPQHQISTWSTQSENKPV